VFATERQSAIKVLRFQRLYERERDVYFRLQSQSIVEVAGFSVPQLIHHDDRLWVVEMGIVSPPFVLDFAGAYLDQRPDYPDEVMEEWQADKLEQFGEERWLKPFRMIMAHFARIGHLSGRCEAGEYHVCGIGLSKRHRRVNGGEKPWRLAGGGGRLNCAAPKCSVVDFVMPRKAVILASSRARTPEETSDAGVHRHGDRGGSAPARLDG
jgi:hypothetical protein